MEGKNSIVFQDRKNIYYKKNLYTLIETLLT